MLIGHGKQQISFVDLCWMRPSENITGSGTWASVSNTLGMENFDAYSS